MSKNRHGRKCLRRMNEEIVSELKIWGKFPEVDSGQYYKTLQRSQKDLKRFLDFVRKEP